MGTPITGTTTPTNAATKTNKKTKTEQSTNNKNKTNQTNQTQNAQKSGGKKRYYSVGPDGRKIDVTSIFEEIEKDSKKNIEEHDKFIQEMFGDVL